MDFESEYSPEEWTHILKEFNRLEGTHYLDHAGTTQYAESQIRDIFVNLAANIYCNPHTSKTTEDLVDQVRYKILEDFNTNTEDYSVVFTSGATAALKLLAETFNFNGGRFSYLRDCHTSVLGMREVVRAKNIRAVEREDFVSEKFLKDFQSSSVDEANSNSLLVFPAQCNFSGFKYPLDLIPKVHEISDDASTNWFVCLDAASFASNNRLDLSEFPADFVCLSFYKQFGYPTGLGALLVRRRAETVIQKEYYGGGTVKIAISGMPGWHQKRDCLHEKLEDGTLPYLSVVSLLAGYKTLETLVPARDGLKTMDRISRHCFNLSKYLHDSLKRLRYSNGNNVVKLYHDSDFSSQHCQGGIVNFNVLHEDGSFVGFAETSCMAAIHNIVLRTGCFCNPGACQRHLNLSDAELKKQFQAGHICGDENDLIGGIPTGSVRVSVGYMTTKRNIDAVINMIADCYLSQSDSRLPLEEIKDGFRQHTLIPQNDKGKALATFEKSVLAAQPQKRYLQRRSDNHLVTNGALHNEISKPQKNKDTNGYSSGVKLKEICVFPVKSCGAFKIHTKWPLTRRGLKFDREWMIVQANGVAMTQKTNTKLCLIRPIIKESENVLELTFPWADIIQVPLELDMNHKKIESSLCQSKVCGDRIDGIDCGDEVADWLSDVLCTSGLRLIRQNAKDKRTSKMARAEQNDISKPAITLSNQSQFLLINETSVRWLANKVEDWQQGCEGEEEHFGNLVDRFRGNFVVETDVALEEREWTSIRFGNILLKVEGPCTRCQMICIDQSTGEKTTEPLRTIAREFQGKMRFGLYLAQTSGINEDSNTPPYIHCDNFLVTEK